MSLVLNDGGQAGEVVGGGDDVEHLLGVVGLEDVFRLDFGKLVLVVGDGFAGLAQAFRDDVAHFLVERLGRFVDHLDVCVSLVKNDDALL